MNVTVTVLIPMYNRQEYIEDCIRSLQAQSWQELEILLVDDGSSDRTVEICRGFAQADPRIRILLSKHGGVSAARNLGLEAATGKYIFFLDSDDVIHPLLVETLAQSMEENGAPLSGTRCYNVPQAHWHKVPEVMARDTAPGNTVYKSHPDVLREVFSGETPLGMIGGVMMLRDWIGQTRFRTDLHIGEDYYFIYENMIKGASAVFLQQKWYYCRIHSGNSSWDYTYTGFETRFYRRRLVWQSEEALGRPEYANVQKRDAFSILANFLTKDSTDSGDKVKIRNTVKAYRKELFPALSWKSKILFVVYVYMPVLTPLLLCLRKKRHQNTGR